MDQGQGALNAAHYKRKTVLVNRFGGRAILKAMRSSPLDRALRRDVARAGGLAALAVSGLGALLLAGQTLASAAFIPGPGGVLSLVLGLLPAVLGVAAPAGLLVGALAAGRRWTEAGDALALMASGLGQRRLAGALTGLGLAVAAFGLLNSHVVEPAGRRLARSALIAAADGLSLRAGQPVTLSGALLRAGRVEGARLGDLFVATDRVVVSAAEGEVGEGGALLLERGEARGVGGDAAGWTLRFARGSMPLDPPARRVELAERTSADLGALINRMSARGSAAHAERLALYKRSTLPLGAPLLALLGLALGARSTRIGLAALGAALSWWAVVRVCDQTVGALGPALAAGLPLIALAAATALAWATWREA